MPLIFIDRWIKWFVNVAVLVFTESHDEEEDDEEGDEAEEAEEENDRPYNLRQRKTVQRYQAPPIGRNPIGERMQPTF